MLPLTPPHHPCIGVYVAMLWQQQGRRGGFCEKTPEAAPMSAKDSCSWLQDGPAAGQS